jgi:phosphatidylserine/phosphatidylglycerophosphate/cardiolipin synthase-like enzyme
LRKTGRSRSNARNPKWKNYGIYEGLGMQLEYAEVVSDKPVQRFLLKFYLSDIPIENLILISPYVSNLEGTRVTLDSICKKAVEKSIPFYVITRSPQEEYHQQAINTLLSYDPIELRYNESLHAKLYLCLCQDESQSFALIGSANLTRNSIEKNIEIAMMIYGRGRGREILRELSHWGLERLRTLNETRLVKKMKLQRR